MCSSQESAQKVPRGVLPSQITILTVGNDKISEMSLDNSPVFIVFQKTETLNHTNNLFQWVFSCKTMWYIYTMWIYIFTHYSFQYHYDNEENVIESLERWRNRAVSAWWRGRTGDMMVVTGCGDIKTTALLIRAYMLMGISLELAQTQPKLVANYTKGLWCWVSWTTSGCPFLLPKTAMHSLCCVESTRWINTFENTEQSLAL